MIEKCNFGKMRISGRHYDSDLWIYPDGTVRDAWWRQDGHRLKIEDISELIASQPQVLVVGTGIFGRMRIEETVKSHLLSRDIELASAWTKPATALFNQMHAQGRNVAACFHLTC